MGASAYLIPESWAIPVAALATDTSEDQVRAAIAAGELDITSLDDVLRWGSHTRITNSQWEPAQQLPPVDEIK